MTLCKIEMAVEPNLQRCFQDQMSWQHGRHLAYSWHVFPWLPPYGGLTQRPLHPRPLSTNLVPDSVLGTDSTQSHGALVINQTVCGVQRGRQTAPAGVIVSDTLQDTPSELA